MVSWWNPFHQPSGETAGLNMRRSGGGAWKDSDDGNDHEEVNWKAGEVCQKRKIRWEKKNKSVIPTYKIYKKGEFG